MEFYNVCSGTYHGPKSEGWKWRMLAIRFYLMMFAIR